MLLGNRAPVSALLSEVELALALAGGQRGDLGVAAVPARPSSASMICARR